MRGHAPASVGATVADLLEMWQEAKAHTWQPTTVREYWGRAAMVSADIGSVRLLDLYPLRIDVWLREMRRRGVGEGAMRGRVSTLKAAASWGVSRRMLNGTAVEPNLWPLRDALNFGGRRG